MMNDIITLVTVTGNTKDADGFESGETVSELKVFSDVKSVRQTEFYAATQTGVSVQYQADINSDDYEQAVTTVDNLKYYPSKVIYEERTYRIYRSFKNGMIYELTLQEVDNG